MKKLTGFAKALILLSIAVPMSLLAIFKLTGVLHEPTIVPETTTLETIKREFERPRLRVEIRETAEGSYRDNNASILYSVFMGGYYEGSARYGSSDYVLLTTNVTATVREGYIESVHWVFREDYENARINFFEEHQFFQLENLSIVDLKDWSKQVFINLSGVNRPTSVYFWTPVDWVLRSPYNQTHRMEIISEVTYFNGTAYRKVVQPFYLKIRPDDTNSFDTADTINSGTTYTKLYLGGYDDEDYYKIHLNEGCFIKVEANGTSSPMPDFYLDLYDPSRNRKARSPSHGYSHFVTFTADSSGDWFIRTRLYENWGFYSLNVSVEYPG